MINAFEIIFAVEGRLVTFRKKTDTIRYSSHSSDALPQGRGGHYP